MWLADGVHSPLRHTFVLEKKSRLPPYNNDHSDDLNHPTKVPKGNLAVSEERLHFFCSFLVFFFFVLFC